jgi:hypothetical protein
MIYINQFFFQTNSEIEMKKSQSDSYRSFKSFKRSEYVNQDSWVMINVLFVLPMMTQAMLHLQLDLKGKVKKLFYVRSLVRITIGLSENNMISMLQQVGGGLFQLYRRRVSVAAVKGQCLGGWRYFGQALH